MASTQINHLDIFCTPFSGELGGGLCLEFTTLVFFGNSCHSCFQKHVPHYWIQTLFFFPPRLELWAVAPFCSRGSLQTLMVLPETSAQLSIKARNELGNALGLFVNESIFKHRWRLHFPIVLVPLWVTSFCWCPSSNWPITVISYTLSLVIS